MESQEVKFALLVSAAWYSRFSRLDFFKFANRLLYCEEHELQFKGTKFTISKPYPILIAIESCDYFKYSTNLEIEVFDSMAIFKFDMKANGQQIFHAPPTIQCMRDGRIDFANFSDTTALILFDLVMAIYKTKEFPTLTSFVSIYE